MKALSWRGAATGLVAGLAIMGSVGDADAQRGGRGGGGAGAARAGSAAINHGGAASMGGFSQGASLQRSAGGQRDVEARASRPEMQQGRQESQAQRQQSVSDNQSARQSTAS